MNKNIELLAPAGDVSAAKTALLAGADAVFCGIDKYNARQRAKNMGLEDLKKLIAIAHGNDARIYLTLNTLFLQSEIDELPPLLDELVNMNVDAVIVQDYGLLYIIQEYYPDLQVHASTQLTTHNIGQLKFLKGYGVSQVNYARELSLDEMKPLTLAAHENNLVVEVFVHGAYCVSFSGQCYMSSALTSHAGNRGSCVQTCRRQYQTESGELRPMNLKDNSAFDYMDELLEVGIDSLKIEGRIKGNRYVYTTVKAWRDGLNEGLQSQQKKSLSTVFNREFSAGYLAGEISNDMIANDTDDHSLEEIGVVRQYSADTKQLILMHAYGFSLGDEIHIYDGPKSFICRGVITSIAHNRYGFKIEDKLQGKIKHGQRILKNSAAVTDAWINKSIEHFKPSFQKIDIVLEGAIDSPITATFSLGKKSVTVISEKSLMIPQNRPITRETVAEKLGKFGGTNFELGSLDMSGMPEVFFIPLGEFNSLRRAAVEQLTPEPITTDVPAIPTTQNEINPERVIILIDSSTLLGDAQENVVYSYELPADIRRQYDTLKELFASRKDLVPWSPPILIGKQYDEHIAFLEVINPVSIFTDNGGVAQWAQDNGVDWEAGPLLNATNRAAIYSLGTRGAKGVVVGLDLSHDQLESITPVEGVATIYPLISPQNLMSSRTCIIRSSAGCHKDVMDEACLYACNRSTELVDEHKRELVVAKQNGQYNRLYMKKRFFCPDALRDLPHHFQSVLVDIREGDDRLPISGNVNELAQLVNGVLTGDREKVKEITQIIGKWDNLQYYDGLR